MVFPGIHINLVLGEGKGEGASVGSVVNHVGFIVDDVQKRIAEWKAKGVAVLPGGNGRLDQAYVVTPDGVRMEILEDKTQTVPIRNEHVHLSLTAAEVPKAQAWYAKTFGGKAGTRNDQPVVDLPGVQFRFATAESKQAVDQRTHARPYRLRCEGPRRVREQARADGIKLDEPAAHRMAAATPSSTSPTRGARGSRSCSGRRWDNRPRHSSFD